MRKQAFFSALKLCLIAACALSLTIVLASQSRRWLLHRLTTDYDSLSPTAQQLRLAEIAALDDLGLPWLVSQLAADDREVARCAYELIAEAQNEWVLDNPSLRESRHRTLIESLQSIADSLPDDRTGWASRLVQQTILEHVESSDPASRQLHQSATDVLVQLSLTGRIDSLADAGEVGDMPRRLTVRSQPLAVEPARGGDAWTDWPPGPMQPAKAASIAGPEDEPLADDEPLAAAPTIYRSSAGEAATATLVATDPTAVALEELPPVQPHAIDSSTVTAAAHRMDAPLQSYNMRSVMYWLASPDQELRRQAELELMRRGLGASELALAKQLSHGDVPSRIESIDRMVREGTVDPRPWLLWLLDDERREVKLHVVTILATMSDPSIEQTLRERMASETDPTVAARLRRALQLR